MKNFVKFINDFKLYEEFENTNFEIVSGEEIRKWYNEKNYAEGVGDFPLLNNSCMRFEFCQKFLDIYVENPENCKMLILLNSDNKLLGRAIMWKIKKVSDAYKVISDEDPYGEEVWDDIKLNDSEIKNLKDTIYIERVYCVDEKYFDLFENYANDRNWSICQKRGARVYGNPLFENEQDQLCAILNPKEYKYYPYMDTFRYYCPRTGFLYNYVPNIEDKILELRSTNGSYTRSKNNN